MKKLATGLVISALVLAAGCDDKKPAAPAPAPAKGGDAKPVEAPKPVEPAKPTVTQATAAGALELFVSAMQKGDFGAALEVLDPASSGYKQLENIYNAPKSNPNLPPAIVEMVKNTFSSGYKDMKVGTVEEEGDHARGVLKPKKGEPVTVELNKLAGKWFLVAPDAIIMPGDIPAIPAGMGGNGAPAPAPAPAPGGVQNPSGAPATPPAGGTPPATPPATPPTPSSSPK